jgi:hypothetical protein
MNLLILIISEVDAYLIGTSIIDGSPVLMVISIACLNNWREAEII